MKAGKLEQWADAAGGGDTEAMEALYDRLAPDLYGYLADLTRDPVLAEDLLHELWLRVIAKLGGRSGPFRPWVFRVARNLAIDHLRARGRARETELTDGVDPGPGPSRMAESIEQADRLRDAVARLPLDRREVVLLRYYSGLSFREIADILGCPVSTAATRLERALAELGKELSCEQRA